MSLFTKAQFQANARAKAGLSGLKGYVNLNESRSFSKSFSVTSIFLSHSHGEKEIIEQAKVFFEKLGIRVYVDWADQTMPERTSAVTANNIKNQIINLNDKFVLLASQNAIASKWCNWEVGIADSFKLHSSKMAILPLIENNGTWNGNEYLQIYPRIEKSDFLNDSYNVIYPDGSLESLTNWLNK